MAISIQTKWPAAKIRDLCDVSRGSSPRPINDHRYFEAGNIPWIKIADATKSGKFLYKTKEYVNEYGASFSKLLPAGTIIVAASGTLGYTQILGVPGCAHDGWLILTNLRNFDRDYAYYVLQQMQRHFYNSAYGAAIQNINTEILRETEIPLPPLPTQRKIATVLSAYDHLIENNLRRIKILEEMAQNLYRDWFVNFRYPGWENGRKVDSPLGQIPEGWEVVPFTEIADVLSGGTPKTSVKEYWGGSIPFFAPKDCPDSFYAIDTEKTITELGLSKCSSKLYPANTVFITARGTVGKVVMAAKEMAMNQSCYALRGKPGINQLYLFLTTLEQVDYLKKNTGGATFDTIVIDTFRRMVVAKPNSEVADRFSQLVRPVMGLILNILQKNTNLRRNRDLLLPKLISGELDVSELDITVPQEDNEL
jgi:type I restriction enzyme, S subunit